MFTKRQEFVSLKDYNWLAKQKHAGRCVANILNACGIAIESGPPNLFLRDLEELAVKYLDEMECLPTFKNYRGFPSSICTSVNEQLVHGVVTDYKLVDGDVITIDLGATYQGVIADAARTFIYGTPKSKEIVRMLKVCEEALNVGIKAAKVGARLGAVGHSIHKYVKDSGFSLITKYGGHGIDFNKPHAEPFVSNRANINDGIRIHSGLTIAIEPMLVMGDTKTKVIDDKWTVIASGIACHYEHSIFIDSDFTHIVTEYNAN